jgi:RNA polymerase sigma factor (sigma-70 family)
VTLPDQSEGRRPEDEWLVIRCQLGERPAFDELIERWHQPIWKYIRRLTGDDEAAHDVTQEVWLRVLRRVAQLRDGSKLRPWLFGIARRTMMDRLRSQYATPAAADVDLDGLAAGNDWETLEEDLAAMQEELARLPVTEREILTLFYLQELSLAEVAQVVGVPAGTVKSRLFRARRLLRRELESKGARS